MIEKSILLRCSPDEAFQLFTARVSEWWPQTHRMVKDSPSEMFLEQNGRFWVRASDGREVDLGHVLIWDPPRRLCIDFYIGTSASQPTAVEVTFTPEVEGTRVAVHHRAKPESEDLWNQRAAVFERSWQVVLDALTNR